MPSDAASADDANVEILAALARLALVADGERPRLTPLSGGVSSDIWKVETPGRIFCIKRALPKLKVAQDWQVPVERSRYEYAWLEEAARHVPEAVPALFGFDAAAGLFALAWLDPNAYRWWKGELRDGRVDVAAAAAVGRAIARIHKGTAGRRDIAETFATDEIFHAIRLEPYLLATARVHGDLAHRLEELSAITADTRLALVHGDVSPKNIMMGPAGPVLLDAECAWYGDPAFDLALCLNHLLLKGLWCPSAKSCHLNAFDSLVSAYLAEVDWEAVGVLERRVAHLLPGLLLARVDGKSPVEYLTEARDKGRVRAFARRFLVGPVDKLAALREAWAR